MMVSAGQMIIPTVDYIYIDEFVNREKRGNCGYFVGEMPVYIYCV